MPDLQSPQGKQEEEPTIQTPKGSSESEEELIIPSVEPRAIADGELEPVDTIIIKDGESYRQMRVYSAKMSAREMSFIKPEMWWDAIQHDEKAELLDYYKIFTDIDLSYLIDKDFSTLDNTDKSQIALLYIRKFPNIKESIEEHECKECGFKSVDFDEYKDHMKAHNTPVGSQGEAYMDDIDKVADDGKRDCPHCNYRTKEKEELYSHLGYSHHDELNKVVLDDMAKRSKFGNQKGSHGFKWGESVATESMDCEFCEGKGKVIVEKKGIKECPRCEGEGTVESNQPNQEQISQDVEMPQEIPQQQEIPQEVPVEEEVPQVEEEEFIDETPEEEHFNLDNFKDEEGKESKANEKEQWITMSGNHILVKDGQTKKQAVSDFLDNVDDDLKSSKKDEPKGKKEDKPKKDKMDKTDYSSKKDFYFKNDDDTIEKKSMTLDEYEKVKDDYKETGWSEAGKKPSQLQKEYEYDETYKKFEEDKEIKYGVDGTDISKDVDYVKPEDNRKSKSKKDRKQGKRPDGKSYGTPSDNGNEPHPTKDYRIDKSDIGGDEWSSMTEQERGQSLFAKYGSSKLGISKYDQLMRNDVLSKEMVSEEQAKDFWSNLDKSDKNGNGLYIVDNYEYDRLTPDEQMAVKERYTDQFKSREQLHNEFRELKEKYPKEYGKDEHPYVDDTERLLRGKSTRLSSALNSGKKTKDNTIVVSDNTDFISGSNRIGQGENAYEEIFEPTQVEGKDGTWEFGGSYTNEKQMKRLAKMAKKDGTLTKGNVKTLMDEATIDADPSENKPIAFKLGGKTYWTAPTNPNYEAEEVKAMESLNTVCPKCGSKNTSRQQTKFGGGQTPERFDCKKCGNVFKPKSNESCGCKSTSMEAYQSFVSNQLEQLQSKAKSGESVGLLYGQEVETDGRKIKGTLAYAGVSLNDRIYLPEELAKGDGLTLPLLLNHSSISGAEMELDRLDGSMKSSLENGQDFKVGEVTLEWIPEKLTLYYEGEVTDPFFQKEIDDANMSVSLGIYYDSDSPSVCNDKCYTVITGAEFREVSLVYHAGFPIATIEEVESGLKKLGESVSKSKSYECISCKDGGLIDATENDIKHLKCLNCGEVNWTRMNKSLESQLLPQLYLPDMTMEGMKIPTVIIQKPEDTSD
jgi:hypothetical protein